MRVLIVVLTVCTTLAVAVGTAVAAASTPHDPIGRLDTVRAASARTIVVRGWAYDPDYPRALISVDVYVDGRGTRVRTGLPRPDVAAAVRGAGRYTGFRYVSGRLRFGPHRVCTYLVNRGPGGVTALGCRTVTLIDPHNPRGSLTTSLVGRTVTARGWAYDPDTRAAIRVRYRIDGGSWYPLLAGLSRPAAPVAGAHGYTRSWTLTPGTHTVCVVAVNVAMGTGNTALGCRRISIVTLNQKIASYARTFVGRYPYAYGGRSPAGFDCSGLTYYIYRHFNRTIPTSAIGQHSTFRRIPSASARPGDLVFFHSSSGAVFHVGVYEGAHMMVAAATPQDGIRYQSIWSSNVSYGTITH